MLSSHHSHFERFEYFAFECSLIIKKVTVICFLSTQLLNTGIISCLNYLKIKKPIIFFLVNKDFFRLVNDKTHLGDGHIFSTNRKVH